MKVTIVKTHHLYPLGDVEVDKLRANYLLNTGIAVPYEKPVVKEKPAKTEKNGLQK